MSQVHGDRGHGYFVPAPESKNLAGRLDCQGLPVTCADPAACQVCHSFQGMQYWWRKDSKGWSIKSVWQGTANAITHNSSEDKDSITVVWTPPSAMSGEVVFQVNIPTVFDPFWTFSWVLIAAPPKPLSQATVVGEKQDRSTYWEEIRSNPVRLWCTRIPGREIFMNKLFIYRETSGPKGLHIYKWHQRCI